MIGALQLLRRANHNTENERAMRCAGSRHENAARPRMAVLGNLDATSGDLAYSWLPPPLIHLVFVSQGQLQTDWVESGA